MTRSPCSANAEHHDHHLPFLSHSFSGLLPSYVRRTSRLPQPSDKGLHVNNCAPILIGPAVPETSNFQLPEPHHRRTRVLDPSSSTLFSTIPRDTMLVTLPPTPLLRATQPVIHTRSSLKGLNIAPPLPAASQARPSGRRFGCCSGRFIDTDVVDSNECEHLKYMIDVVNIFPLESTRLIPLTRNGNSTSNCGTPQLATTD